MVAIRDLKCSMDIAEMAKLGWFAEEFIVYGCCYVENGTVYYKVSSQNTELYHFQEDMMKQGIYVSPVMELLNRALVPSGRQDEYMLRTKIKLAKTMQQNCDEALLKSFAALAGNDDNDSAAALIYQLKKKMIGCFEREVVQLVGSIISYAYQQKKLKRQTYQELCQWLDYVYSQMEDDVVVKRNFSRTFYGFAYRIKNGTIKYYTNASEGETRKRKEELLCKGTQSTPILKKTYYFDNQPDLLQVKDVFVQQMKLWMDEEYMDYLRQIDALPAAISQEYYQEFLTKVQQSPTGLMQNYFTYYQYLWHIPVTTS